MFLVLSSIFLKKIDFTITPLYNKIYVYGVYIQGSKYGEFTGEKPVVGEVEGVKFYTITYDLQEGTTKESFVYNYNSYAGDAIPLPTLTKANHQFMGWLLNGELVTEIPANATGNLHLVAQFTVLEGEVYTIEFVTNKENVIWPSRAALGLLVELMIV